MGALHVAHGLECPAGAAAALILDVCDVSLLAPVLLLGSFVGSCEVFLWLGFLWLVTQVLSYELLAREVGELVDDELVVRVVVLGY